MTARLRALDDHLIRLTQEVYLWLWDRTGVYVATLMFAAVVGDHVFWHPLEIFDFIVLAFFGVWAGVRYVAQAKDLRWLNATQRAWADFWLRRPVMVVIAVLLAGDVLKLDAWRAASDVCSFAWNYLACVQVRDREPQDLLSFRKTVGAGA